MSTFRGVMVEFPRIYVDYFRLPPGPGGPLACFLSHVHSDHLAGLDTFKGSFIYCSAVTKALLMKLEKKTHRVNYANGFVEATKRNYKFQETRLKSIPLETPTKIELGPHNVIQVTLFDANHCSGSVMFLFEQDQKAVLYTGDIRSEPWFVNNLVRNPFLIEYTSGMKTLDCIYLDTSNLEAIPFQTKAEGLRELIAKVRAYPDDTTFHLAAWTFGYEEVWMALNKALGSQIHLDSYKLHLYQSLPVATPGTVLGDYSVGNTQHQSFLTSDSSVRLHSCEKGMRCSKINANTVMIRPIVARLDTGAEIGEVGVGGGGGDLQQHSELDLTGLDLDQFISMFGDVGNDLKMDIALAFARTMKSGRNSLNLEDLKVKHEEEDLSLRQIVDSLMKSAAKHRAGTEIRNQAQLPKANHASLPKIISFPYSRHSSYEELCHLVRAFKPKDVYPCTIDEEYWHRTGKSIGSLFGNECSGRDFRYDAELAQWVTKRPEPANSSQQSLATTQRSQDSVRSLGFGNQQRAPSGSPSLVLQRDKPVIDSPEPILEGCTDSASASQLPSPEDTKIITTTSSLLNEQAVMPPALISTKGNKHPQIITPKVAPEATRSIPKDSKGPMRMFDQDANEVTLNAAARANSPITHDPAGTSWGNSINLQDTPPGNITAKSPGSASQRLRRKIILDGLDEDGGSHKKPRLDSDGQESNSFMTSSDDQVIATLRTAPNTSNSTWLANSAISLADVDAALPNTGRAIDRTKKQTKILDALLPEHVQMSNSLNARSSFLQADTFRQAERERKNGIRIKAQSTEDQMSLDAPADNSSSAEQSNLSTNFNDPEDEVIAIDDSEDDESQTEDDQVYYDPVDEVCRCRICGHELWTISGFCIGCEDTLRPNAGSTTPCLGSLTEDPYYEIGSEDETGKSNGPHPLRIAATEYDEEIGDEAIAQELAGDYLDNDPEAYDSQDSSDEFIEEYNLADSFIDDAAEYETDSESSNRGDDNSEGETDYKAKYKELLAVETEQRRELEELKQAHNRLARDYIDMDISFTDLKRSIGINTDSEEELDGIFDDNGNLMVEVEVPDVALTEVLVPSPSSSQESTTEIVLNQALEQSQNSMLDTQRIEDRVRGFEAAEQGVWNEVSLLSTGDNHTNLEYEL